MRSVLAFICCLLCVFGSHFCVFAADSGEIVCDDISAKEGRLIYVDVCIKSRRNLAAGSFLLSYDADKLEFRSASTEVPGGEVHTEKSGGGIKAVFLCADGLILKNTPLVFSVEFKKLTEESSTVNISAEDCFDSRLKPINDLASAECRVSTSEIESVRSTTGRVYHKVKAASKSSKARKKETALSSSKSDSKVLTTPIKVKQRVEHKSTYDTRPLLIAALFIAALFITALFLAAVIKINLRKNRRR